MTPQQGRPLMDGRYVVFVPCWPRHDTWLEPHIVQWRDGVWRFLNSEEKYPDTVHYWMGPLPILKKPEISFPEFDL